jgi:hypothetical protein
LLSQFLKIYHEPISYVSRVKGKAILNNIKQFFIFLFFLFEGGVGAGGWQ